jgi:Ni/Fe-hydrogenase subunit HybB-like protein
VPDIAAARDRATGWRKKLYQRSLGWQGTDSQWRPHPQGYLFLAALATPLVLSVHSVVSWDFAMSIVPGWHATIFAPYFVAGAIFSGIAMVITLLIPAAEDLRARAHHHDYHFDNLAEADAAHLADRLLRLPDGVLRRLVQRRGGRADTAFWNRAFGPTGGPAGP